MHYTGPEVTTGGLIPRPTAEDDACVLCGYWRCRCVQQVADVAWEEALAALAADVDGELEELVEAARVEALVDYGRRVLGTEVDVAGVDALGDMVEAGLISPGELAVPAPAVRLLTAATAWIGEDLEDEDDRRGYEPEDVVGAPRCGWSTAPVGQRMPDDEDDACPGCGYWQCRC
ncbi:hypothetical protein SAMN06297387_13127 [Streptomyces zhaozhouensis]|uniref:Uncharacterized protein n=2 Tax=Streptomyces zhaozhouensis TaxID=1300267 RepID=A0A286E992_9ACTN|nr:hypothetical protein SAMN06297387_13127 [Streptomyces zhaozhouensis]